jgi:hypothetical protein
VRDRQGRFILGPTLAPGTTSVFSAKGQLLQTLGKSGRGPGEMREVQGLAVGLADSIVVTHDFNRVTVFAPELRFARTFRIQSPSFIVIDLLVMADGSILAPRLGTGGGSDYALRFFSTAGTPGQGFGPSTLLDDGRVYLGLSSLADTIWAGNRMTYEIDEYVRPGRKARVRYRRTPSWFPQHQKRGPDGAWVELSSMTRSSTGFHWVLLRRPRPDRPILPATSGAGIVEAAAVQPGVGDMQRDYEWILELLDLHTGRLIATSTLERRVAEGFLDSDHLYGYEEDPDTGSLTVVVWKLALQQR